MKIICALFLIITTSGWSMVPNEVPHAEKLFVRQLTPVWCWAAMAEGLSKYYHAKPKQQELIASGNPYPVSGNPVSVYYINPARINNQSAPDYLLDEVLGDFQYRADLESFNHAKVLNLLASGNPVMISKGGHVTMIYGYTKIGEEIFYNIFDPNAYAFLNPETFLVHQYEFEPTWSGAGIVFLTKKHLTSQN